MTELLCKTADARPAGDAERSAKPAVKDVCGPEGKQERDECNRHSCF